MKIEVNGEIISIKAENITGLIAEVGYKDMVCAVAVNGGFVPRDQHAATYLAENDQIDIVAPMKGG
jgi:sulfur carrier protein